MARDLLPLVREALADTYAVEREIGKGGAARVYLAKNAAGDAVALKVLHPELQLSSMADRFLREIRLASSVAHPLIAPVLDSGKRDWLVYYVMPLIEGPTLRQCITREMHLTIPDTVRVGAELLDALEHAHARRIVHRDVKPENVIISRKGAVLVDFGVARAIEALAADRVTATGMTVGTAGYMSPEQAAADPDLDFRSDIYAVGAVLFECLAGRPPYSHRNQHVVLQMQLAQSAPDVRTFRPDTPEPLALAIARALEKDRALRWQTAEAMRDTLMSLIAAR